MSFLTHLDLFSGIGGFAIAAQACGFRTVAFCEIEPYAQQVLKEKFGAVVADSEGDRCDKAGPKQSAASDRPRLHRDIFSLNGADYLGVDLITGGFPCQPYSLAGKRRGAADDRAIWPEMRRVIAEARPAWVLGENVPGIINMELDRVLSDLEALGYAYWPLVIPACAVDARHRRDRVWIVGHASGERIQGFGTSGKQVSFPHDGTGLPMRPGEDVANPTRKQNGRLQQQRIQPDIGAAGDGIGKASVWLPEPDVGRVAHGIPHRAHRLRALGNAIVPAVAYQILKPIAEMLDNENLHKM